MKIVKKKFQTNPIAYKSRKFCPSLESFSSTEKEAEKKETDEE